MKNIFFILTLLIFCLTQVVAQDVQLESNEDEILSKLKQLRQQELTSEAQIEKIFDELGLTHYSHSEVSELSDLLRQDLPGRELDDHLLQFISRTLRQHQDMISSPSNHSQINKANNQPLTTEQQAIIAQVLEDFQVNENAGRCNHNDPVVAIDHNGNFLIAWRDERNCNYDIYGRRYHSNGIPSGTDFKINDDVKILNSKDHPFRVVPQSKNDVVVGEGYLNALLPKLSWNVIRLSTKK